MTGEDVKPVENAAVVSVRKNHNPPKTLARRKFKIERRENRATMAIQEATIAAQEKDISKLEIERNTAIEGGDTDDLTKLFNKAKFERDLEAKIGTSENPRNPRRKIILMCMDIDHFKDVNDAFGHGVGDQLLSRMQEFKAFLREEEPLYRWGGDEFVQILEDVPEEELIVVAERYQAFMRKISAEVLANAEIDQETIREKTVVRRIVDFSIGFAKHDEGDDVTALFKKADGAMYSSKTHEEAATLAETRPDGGRYYKVLKQNNARNHNHNGTTLDSDTTQ